MSRKNEIKIDFHVNWIIQYRHVNGRCSPNELTMYTFSFLKKSTESFAIQRGDELIVQLICLFRISILESYKFVGFSIWIAASLNGISKGYFRFQLVGSQQSVFSCYHSRIKLNPSKRVMRLWSREKVLKNRF